MTRVLLLIKGLGRGGAEQIVLSIVRNGDRKRFEYEVAYLLPHKAALLSEFARSGVRTHCLHASAGPGWVVRLDRLARDRHIDIVHAHSPVPAVGARVRPRRGTLVYTEHNVWSRYARRTYWANAATFARNDHVFAVSEEVRRSIRYPVLLRRRRLPPVETMYHGVDTGPPGGDAEAVRKEFGIPRGGSLVVTVANLKRHKGHRHLLDAIALTNGSHPEARFVLVGVGPLEAELRSQVRSLELDDRVTFAGFRPDARAILEASDLFVLPSEQEGLPLALLEAMSSGKPCVATLAGGIPEVVSGGVDALVVPPADPRALSAAMSRLLADEALRDELGRNARERARAFDVRRAVSRMEEVYAGLSNG